MVDPWSVKDAKSNHEGLFGSLLLGRIDDVCVVESTSATKEYDLAEFQDYTQENDDLLEVAGVPYLIRLRISDDEGRELQIHARMSEEYLDIEQGMPATGISLSTSQSFTSLSALTDIYIPDAACFVGDYPYLNRNEVQALFMEDDDLWDLLQSQGEESVGVAVDEIDEEEDESLVVGDDDNDFDVDDNDRPKVPIRRRRGGGRRRESY
jgi:hypothetical protein